LKQERYTPLTERRVGRVLWQRKPEDLTGRQKLIIKKNWRNKIYGLNCLSLLAKDGKSRATNECLKLFAEIEGLPPREFKKGGTYTSSNEIRNNRFGFQK